MAQFGSSNSYSSGNLSATQDPNGNPIISSENNFGASPLGVAARTQALYGLPNGHFDLTCADPGTAVTVDNAIPYWNLETSGTIATTMVFDATTQNWSVRIDPTGAASGDYAILKSRTYLLNDDALALRQKAYASLTKQGTTGTAQWSIVLSATYFDQTGAQLSTYNIGTAADTGTWTGINGITTSGSAAISTSAAYADIALTLTAAGSVSGTAKVDINSVLIATSQTGGASSFLITQTFLSSGTWTRPTGVDYVTVVAMGGGQAGASGDCISTTSTGVTANGGQGGNSGVWALVRDIALGTATTVSVGVGAGGAAGTAFTFSKAAAGTATTNQVPGTATAGGATTFGSFLSVPGGKGGGAGGISFGFLSVGGGTAASVEGGANGNNGASNSLSSYPLGVPYTTFVTGGGAGGNASRTGGSGGTAVNGAPAGTAIGIGGGGGAGATVTASTSPSATGPGTCGDAGAGSGGGGAAARTAAAAQTIVLVGGAGGTVTANSGAGGGGGGAVAVSASSVANYNSSTLTMTSGAGRAGAAGFLTVVYVG